MIHNTISKQLFQTKLFCGAVTPSLVFFPLSPLKNVAIIYLFFSCNFQRQTAKPCTTLYCHFLVMYVWCVVFVIALYCTHPNTFIVKPQKKAYQRIPFRSLFYGFFHTRLGWGFFGENP